ncbi:c-type cytochrome [Marinobacter adhaerens]|uniref:C-type cytochrome n=1 Tax=Marinobacter adhaerens TaxID=1033846 RepID=A0A851I1B4_9GAMM|nr:c-type cytochrome [Marinobacter adhaerens]NWN91908.1 c-type cytochrome [Marinobacter adhaerens]
MLKQSWLSRTPHIVAFVVLPLLSLGAAAGAEPPDNAGNPLAAEFFGAQEQKVTDEALTNARQVAINGKGATWSCASCHGENGAGNSTAPRIAGLAPGYITKQLHDYRSGARQNANMEYVVAELSDKQMLALGQYYSRLESHSSAGPDLGGDISRGRQLAQQGDWKVEVPACFSCHGSTGWGVGQAFPALAAQHPSYTAVQLSNWKSGRRSNSPVKLMHGVAVTLSDDDIRAVADYLATLPPPQQGTDRNAHAAN